MPRPARYRVRSVAERFAAYCVPVGDCVVWRGPVARGGYPVIGEGTSKAINARSYVLGYRQVPKGMVTVSCCLNRLCVNTKHLWLADSVHVGPRISHQRRQTLRKRLSSPYRVKPPKAFVGPLEHPERKFWRECGVLFFAVLPDLIHGRRLRQREYERRRDMKLRQKDPERWRIKQRAREHRRRGAPGRFTKADIDRLFLFQRGKCAICRCELKTYDIDHIMPIALGGTNDPDNLQLLCKPCNNHKGATHPVEYMQQRGYLI